MGGATTPSAECRSAGCRAPAQVWPHARQWPADRQEERRLTAAEPNSDPRRRELAIKADPADQRRLLDLQAIDTALAQLAHRRRTLPEHAEISRLRSTRSDLASDLVGADTAVSDLEREQEQAESDLEPVRERLSRNQHRVADGSVGDPRALSGLIEEIDHLKRRIDTLEEAELEVMEQLESATEGRQKLRHEAAEIDRVLAALSAKRDVQLRELEVEMADRQVLREGIVSLLPASLLAMYDKIGASHAGVGAAELRARRCTGCRLEINGADLRAFAAAPPEEVLRCEECGRILVRTPESGL